MSAPNLPKRRLVDEVKKELFEMKVNALSDAGYTMEAFAISPGYSGQDVGESYPSFTCVMKLKTEPDENYEGTEDVMEVPISKVGADGFLGSPLISKATAEGWRVVNIYKGTKDTPSTAIMVRRKRE